MPVTAVRAKNDIFPVQMMAYTSGNRLLSDICVASTVNKTTLVCFRQSQFRLADKLHLAIKNQTGFLGGDHLRVIL
jgi:hypothetical protein